MSETIYSPGPWRTDTEQMDGEFFCIHQRSGNLIAAVSRQVKVVGIDDEAIRDGARFGAREIANAKLIAAAPEMLEVLQTAISNYDSLKAANAAEPGEKNYSFIHDEKSWLKWIEAANDIVKKATE